MRTARSLTVSRIIRSGGSAQPPPWMQTPPGCMDADLPPPDADHPWMQTIPWMQIPLDADPIECRPPPVDRQTPVKT